MYALFTKSQHIRKSLRVLAWTFAFLTLFIVSNVVSERLLNLARHLIPFKP